jgi:hypothetical protein
VHVNGYGVYCPSLKLLKKLLFLIIPELEKDDSHNMAMNTQSLVISGAMITTTLLDKAGRAADANVSMCTYTNTNNTSQKLPIILFISQRSMKLLLSAQIRFRSMDPKNLKRLVTAFIRRF